MPSFPPVFFLLTMIYSVYQRPLSSLAPLNPVVYLLCKLLTRNIIMVYLILVCKYVGAEKKVQKMNFQKCTETYSKHVKV
jgi:hypothetical protein